MVGGGAKRAGGWYGLKLTGDRCSNYRAEQGEGTIFFAASQASLERRRSSTRRNNATDVTARRPLIDEVGLRRPHVGAVTAVRQRRRYGSPAARRLRSADEMDDGVRRALAPQWTTSVRMLARLETHETRATLPSVRDRLAMTAHGEQFLRDGYTCRQRRSGHARPPARPPAHPPAVVGAVFDGTSTIHHHLQPRARNTLNRLNADGGW